ncbi:MAG: SGNH/GDSL hydrolase family protein [Solirubrobacterales bacterium]
MSSIFRYVALGDSTTEGLDDPYPGSEVYRGFADRLAERLARLNPDFRYANLAVRGRLMRGIREEQLEPALAMNPDLASIIGGVNDILRPKVDIDELGSQMEEMQRALVDQGATVIGMTLPDLSDSMGVAKIVSQRLEHYNQAMREAAQRSGALLIDIARQAGAYDPACWSIDRLHANSKGHELIALAAADGLELPGASEELAAILAPPLPVVEKQPRLRAIAHETAWVWTHLRPWIMRRLRGQSSGDGISAKRPELLPVGSELSPVE